MVSNQENELLFPHENVESEIMVCFRETEQDINVYRIIHAYYNLKKTSKLIAQLPKSSTQKDQFKEKQKLLNNLLNNKILKFIEKHGR